MQVLTWYSFTLTWSTLLGLGRYGGGGGECGGRDEAAGRGRGAAGPALLPPPAPYACQEQPAGPLTLPQRYGGRPHTSSTVSPHPHTVELNTSGNRLD